MNAHRADRLSTHTAIFLSTPAPAEPARRHIRGCYRKAVALVIALMMSNAHAADGRIGFSGAIVEPTCGAFDGSVAVMMTGNGAQGRSFTCAGGLLATAADPSAYRLSVMHLDEAATTGNLLLQYFVGYHASADTAAVQMVTRVYE